MHTETLMSTQIISGIVYTNFKYSLAGKFSLVIYFYESKADTLREEPDIINYALLVMILPKFFCKSDASSGIGKALEYLFVIATCIKIAFFYVITSVTASPTLQKLLQFIQKCSLIL